MPVSGWWLPIRIDVLVMPGADAVSPELLGLPDEELGLEPQAAATIASTASPATAAACNRCDLFMWCLPPGVHWPASAGARRSRGVRCAAPPARRAGAARPGFPTGTAA